MEDKKNYIQFEDIVSLEFIENFAKSFYNITGMILDIDNPEGFHPKKYYKNNDENDFCKIIKSNQEALLECLKTGKEKGAIAAKENKPKIYTCHAGMIDVAVPILIKDRHIATLSTGQVLLSKPTKQNFDNIINSVKKYNLDINKLKKAYFNTKVLNRQILKDYINLLKLVIDYIVEIEDKIIFLKHKISNEYIIERAKAYIEKNYYKKIYLDDIAKQSCVSKYYFVRLFKKETNLNFTDYLNLVRISKAKKMLTHCSIAQTCYDVGFNSLPHFYNIFKRFEGCTPNEYKKNLKIQITSK